MNLIILAAGVGSRLFPLTKDKPKSLIDLGDGTTLLDRQIQNAINCDIIDTIYIVTGYRASQIEEKIEQYKSEINIVSLYNPFYETSNNLFSLWFAQFVMDGKDFLISNGDNIYKDNVYNNIHEISSNTISITIDYKTEYDEDDMKVTMDEKGNVKHVSKLIHKEKISAESVGLAIVKGSKNRKIFKEKLASLVKDITNKDKFWLEIFNALATDGQKIGTYVIEKRDWGEIDFHPDIQSVKAAISKELF
jgi:choline kinase